MAGGGAATNKRWTKEELRQLRMLAERGVSAPEAAVQFRRSTSAVQQKAIELGIALIRVDRTQWRTRPETSREPERIKEKTGGLQQA